MGFIAIRFKNNQHLDLNETAIVKVTDRQTGQVDGKMSVADSFSLYYQSAYGNGVVYQHINCLSVNSWDYYSVGIAESCYREDDPYMEKLRKRLAVLAHNNEIFQAIKDLE